MGNYRYQRLVPRKNIRFGNKKLPSTTAIFNICAAHDCPSRKLGLCQVINAGHRCYALRDEQFYGHPLGYRRRQEKLWNKITATNFVMEFLRLRDRRRGPTTALRLNESGDFRSQEDLWKAERIAWSLKDEGITTYCYTARSDLDFSVVRNLVVNGSGFKVKGEFRFIKAKADKPKGYGICPGVCKSCTRCQKGSLTCVLPH